MTDDDLNVLQRALRDALGTGGAADDHAYAVAQTAVAVQRAIIAFLDRGHAVRAFNDRGREFEIRRIEQAGGTRFRFSRFAHVTPEDYGESCELAVIDRFEVE